MAEEISDLRGILDGTDWAALDDGSGMTCLDTPAMLEALTSGDARLVRAGILYLEHAFIEYPNVFSATVPATHYVVALLNGSLDEDPVVLNAVGRCWPLRAHLLEWLAGVAEAVSDAEVQRFVDLAGFSPLEYPTWPAVRRLRPQMFDVAAAFLEHQDLVVRRGAIAAASVLVRVPELACHREAVAASVRNFLEVCTNPIHRQFAADVLGEVTAGHASRET